MTLLMKVHIVKAMVFPIVMYGCESWTIKQAEHQRIDAFQLWCWRRLLRVPWTPKRSNQSILKEINPECSLEAWCWNWNSNILATWCKELTQWKDPDAGKGWRQEEKEMTEDEMVGWHHWFDGHEFEQALGVGDGQGSLACCSPWDCKELDTAGWLNWTEQRGFPGGASVQNLPVNAGDIRDAGSVSGLGRLPGARNDNPLQPSCLENPHGQKSLAGYSPQGCKVSDTSEVTEHAQVLRMFLFFTFCFKYWKQEQ